VTVVRAHAAHHIRQAQPAWPLTHRLTICNVATSAMVRECELAYITRAGVEIGVASTKAFTTQLAGLYLLTVAWQWCAGACQVRHKPPS